MAETKTDGDVATPLALGGPVMGARIYVDTNGDGLLDIGSDPLLGLTDQSGSIQIDQQYAGQRLIADVGDAVDLLAGERLETGTVYTFIAPPDGNLIVSPLRRLDNPNKKTHSMSEQNNPVAQRGKPPSKADRKQRHFKNRRRGRCIEATPNAAQC